METSLDMAGEAWVPTGRRQTEILASLRTRGSCSIGDLARQLHVSEETIRRNLKPLVARGLLHRVHGGVMLPQHLGEPPFERRMRENHEAKRRIAVAAAEMIEEGDSIMLDTGSTTAYVSRELYRHSKLVVVTNSAEIARGLATRNGNRVYMAGGELRADDAAAFGPAALSFLRQFRVKFAILSIGAIDERQGLMDFHLNEGELSRTVMGQAEQIVVVADHSKFGRSGLVRVCDLSEIHVLITDREPPPAFGRKLQEGNVRVVVAPAP